jgi:hypothetical protein
MKLIGNGIAMSDSFRKDWRIGTALLVALLALGIIGGVLVYWFTPALGAPLAYDKGKIEFATTIGPLCSDDSGVREQVRGTVLAGLENALRQHVEKIMGVWISDGGVNPSRAANGVWIGSRAYLHARQQIESWDIPACEGKK